MKIVNIPVADVLLACPLLSPSQWMTLQEARWQEQRAQLLLDLCESGSDSSGKLKALQAHATERGSIMGFLSWCATFAGASQVIAAALQSHAATKGVPAATLATAAMQTLGTDASLRASLALVGIEVSDETTRPTAVGTSTL